MKDLYETIYGHYVSQYNSVKYVDYRKNSGNSPIPKKSQMKKNNKETK